MVSYYVSTPEEYLAAIPPERRPVIESMRQLILNNLPEGYVEKVNWGMLSYEIPLEVFAETYNKQPLGYVALAAQKQKNSLYLMSPYADPKEYQELMDAYAEAGLKPDLGKSCLRFKKMEDLPLEKISALIRSKTPDQFIVQYKKARDQR